MPLPSIDVTRQGVLRALNELMFTMWQNPESPGLDFFKADVMVEEGFTEFNPYPLAQDVLTAPIVAPLANPRAVLPVIDGQGRSFKFIDHFEIKVPLEGETVDEYEARMLTAKLFGKDVESLPVEDRFQARLAYAQTAILNRLSVFCMNMIESASIVAQDLGNGVDVTNTFVRNTITTTAGLNTDSASYADLTAGSLAGRRWVESNDTLNTSATPYADVQAMIATLKRWGGGRPKYFVMSSLAMKAYQLDFKTNFSDLYDKTNILLAGAQFTVPIEAQKQGWHIIGYVHDESENFRLVPVVGGSNVMYLNWMNRSALQNFLPTYEFAFPVGEVPTIGSKHTWIRVERLMKEKNLLGVNIWTEEETGGTRGAVLTRQTMYPRVSPNALVFWKVG